MKTKDKAIVGLGLAIDSLLYKTRGGSADVEAARRIVQVAWEVFKRENESPQADDSSRCYFAVTCDGIERFRSEAAAKGAAERSLAGHKKDAETWGEWPYEDVMEICWGRIIEQVVEVPYPGDGDKSDYVLRRLP